MSKTEKENGVSRILEMQKYTGFVNVGVSFYFNNL